ncbi:MAG: hypothetical protein ABI171_22290 [Collimonas sp.]|uniref:hypothetical protein n=1 Tax=Collimonas sp. TaxID=1963772 RepID=UPI003264497E
MDRDSSDIEPHLSLKIATPERPFELVGNEENFGPEDWAWFFLRKNEKYITSYLEHKQKTRKDPVRKLMGSLKQSSKVKALEIFDHAHFGLSDWVNPSELLPELGKNESWFFPLKNLVLENYGLVSDYPEKYLISDTVHQQGRYPFLASKANAFGYKTPDTNEWNERAFEEPGIELMWVAVDCSVPVKGQMTSLLSLAKINRNYLSKKSNINQFKKSPAMQHAVERISECNIFNHFNFTPVTGAPESQLSLESWRAVRINLLGNLVEQVGACEIKLNDIHKEAVKQKLATVPHRRLRTDLPNVQSGNSRGNGGHYLKAILTVYELHDQGWDDHEILHCTHIARIDPETERANLHKQNAWKIKFGSDLDDHIATAKRYVEGDYRWLIHIQKPVPARRKATTQR